jgi:hypothetical protein
MIVQFYKEISKNPQTSNFIKILPQATELFRMERHTDAKTQYGQKRRRLQSVLVILRTILKNWKNSLKTKQKKPQK